VCLSLWVRACRRIRNKICRVWWCRLLHWQGLCLKKSVSVNLSPSLHWGVWEWFCVCLLWVCSVGRGGLW
jgi:hypothetical protein